MVMKTEKNRQTANLELVKQSNLTLVFNFINAHQPVSRASIARATGLSPTTVSSLADELISENMIEETGMGTLHGSGRKPIMLAVKTDGGCVVAVEVRKGTLEFEVFDLKGNSVVYQKCGISDYEKLGDIIADEVEKIYKGHGRLLGICVGVPGIVDKRTKRVLSKLIPVNRDNNFFDVLRMRFPDVKIKLGNESSFCAYIEKVEAKKDIHSLVYIDINVGIGSGIILDDRIYTGAFGNAGEFGHMSVDADGRVCKCGNRGCIEEVAGPPAICKALGVSSISEIDTNDKSVYEKLDDICKYFACGINNIMNMINPEAVVLGGEVTYLGQPFLDRIKKKLDEIMFSADPEVFSLRFSSVSGNAVTKGGGKYLLDRIFEDGDFIIE